MPHRRDENGKAILRCSECGEVGHTKKRHDPFSERVKRCLRCGRVGHTTEEHDDAKVSYAKYCGICGSGEHRREFHKPRDTERECMVCGEVQDISAFHPRGRGFRHECRTCVSKKHQSIYRSSWEGRFTFLVNAAKPRARDVLQLPCEITVRSLLDQLERQGGRCYYTGLPLTLDTGEYGTSIDRRDSTLGYTAENTVLSFWIVNRMKRDTPEKEFVNLCAKIADHSRFDHTNVN